MNSLVLSKITGSVLFGAAVFALGNWSPWEGILYPAILAVLILTVIAFYAWCRRLPKRPNLPAESKSLIPPVDRAQLRDIYESCRNLATETANYYRTHRAPWRVVSYCVRAISFAGLLIGIVAPLVPIDLFKDDGAEIGYAALAIGALVLALDRIFIVSDNWIRYKRAHRKIETIVVLADMDWARVSAQIPVNSDVGAAVEPVLDLCRRLIEESRAVVSDELAAWGTRFEEAQEFQRDLIKRNAEDAKTIAEEKRLREEEGQATNGVVVEIGDFEKLKGKTTVSLGVKKEIRDEPVASVVFESVPTGQHKLMLRSMMGNRLVGKEGIVIVKAGDPIRVSI